MLPYDVEVTYSGSSRGVMLARDENGALQFRRATLPELVAQQRTDAFSYQHRDPRIDIPAAFERFNRGAGFLDIPKGQEPGFSGYYYSQGVDASWGSRAFLSPKANSSNIGTYQVRKFLKTDIGLFALTNKTIQRWNGTSWADVYTTAYRMTDIIGFKNGDGTYVLAGIYDAPYVYTMDGLTWRAVESAATTPSYRATANATTSGDTSVTPTEPTGAASGDILIMVSASDTVQGYPNSTAWKPIVVSRHGAGFWSVWWTRRGGSAPSYQMDYASSTAATVVVTAYQNVRSVGSPFDSIGATTPATTGGVPISNPGTTHTFDEITVSGANRLTIGILASNDSTGGMTPGSGTDRADVDSANGSIETFDLTGYTSGDITSTSASSVDSGTVLLSLRPAASTGASGVARWAVRGQSSGSAVLWARDEAGSVRSCTDPTVASSWSTADALQTGQRASVLGFEVVNNVFYDITTRGIVSYDGTTVKTVFDAQFAEPTASTTISATSFPWVNGTVDVARPVVGPDLNIYFTYGASLLRFDPENVVVEKVWPRGPQEGNSVLTGTITALSPSQRHIYFALSSGYIMKFDPFESFVIDGETVYPTHSIAYAGYNTFSTQAIAYIQAGASHSLHASNPQLLIGSEYDAGMGSYSPTIEYFIMPRDGRNPGNDSNCRFETSGTLYGSFGSWNARSFNKWLTRGDIEATTTTTKTVKLQYQLENGSATDIVTANTAQTGRTSATLTPVAFSSARGVVVFASNADTASPELMGTVLHAAPNAPRDSGFIMVARIKDGLLTNQNTKVSWQAAELETFLFSSVNQIVTIRDPRGTSWTVKVLDVDVLSATYDANRNLETRVQMTLGQLTS